MGYILIDREISAVFKLSAKDQEGAFREALKRLGYAVKVQIESVEELALYKIEDDQIYCLFVYALHDYDAEQYAQDVVGVTPSKVGEVEAETVKEYHALGWPGEVYSAYPSVVAVEDDKPVLLRA